MIRLTRDVDLAEDLAQAAMIAALERWPEAGPPENPGAWLMTTAKHRAIDAVRRVRMVDAKRAELTHESPVAAPPSDHEVDDPERRFLHSRP